MDESVRILELFLQTYRRFPLDLIQNNRTCRFLIARSDADMISQFRIPENHIFSRDFKAFVIMNF